MSNAEAIPMILDVDTGLDDALALVLAVRSPVVDLLALTTVTGNVNIHKATANTLAVMDYLGHGAVPVHRGASRPLVEPIFDASDIHGVTGLGNALLPESGNSIGPDRGPAAIIRLAKQRPGEITLVCTGPLTNLAIALNVEPELGSLLKRVVIMGGVFREPGNVKPWGEFNIMLDPDAAQQVFEANLPDLTVIGLDVTHQTIIDRALFDRLDASDHRDGRLVADIIRYTFETRARDRFFMHDPLALGVAIDPSLVTCEQGTVTVDVTGAERGATRFHPGIGGTKVAFGVDVQRFLTMYGDALGISHLVG
jgi:inosine-uridine nucleoside N-ribohydrolase